MGNDNILKALKQCVNGRGFCCGCPLSFEPGCRQQLLECALKIINCQRAEIERLETEIDKQYEQAEADILGNISDGGTSCHWCIEQHRTKAIKEFAERLKEDSKHFFVSTAFVDRINYLVKEMTEVRHAETD
jgi:hypothetical protein